MLNTFNLSLRSIDWFGNCLKDRMQCGKGQGFKSTLVPVTFGVLQGSILAPLLFIIPINDLYQYLQDCSLSLYSDDAILYIGKRPS